MRRTLFATFAGIVAGATCVLLTHARAHDAVAWNDPAYQRHECEAAAGIAAKRDDMILDGEIAQPFVRQIRTAYMRVLVGVAGARSIGFGPNRQNVGERQASDRLMHSGPLDCGAQFHRVSVRTVPLEVASGDTYNVVFSRIWLTDDGRRAEFFSQSLCGNTCGGLSREVWIKTVKGWQQQTNDNIAVF